MDNYYDRVYHPVISNSINKLLISHGIRWDNLKGYFIGNKLVRVVVLVRGKHCSQMVIDIDKEDWYIKSITAIT